jgi:hypothetical protein
VGGDGGELISATHAYGCPTRAAGWHPIPAFRGYRRLLGLCSVPTMRVRPDHRSSDCDDGRHLECGHRLGNVGHLFRKMESPHITLCQCDCHLQCPIATDEGVPETDWYERCVCTGAEESKQRHRTRDEERAARKRAAAEIRASIDPTGKSRAELRAELEAAYQERGMNPSSYELDDPGVPLTYRAVAIGGGLGLLWHWIWFETCLHRRDVEAQCVTTAGVAEPG